MQRGIHDEFVARFVAAAEALTLGDPKDPATEIGPLASEEHWKKVAGYLDDVAAGTGRMLTGGSADGWFVRPTVVVDAPLDSRVVCEEIFGPVVMVHPFDTEEEAVADRQRLAVRPQRHGLHREPVPCAPRRRPRCGPARCGSTASSSATCARRSAACGDSGVGREGGNFSREFFTEPKAVVMQL